MHQAIICANVDLSSSKPIWANIGIEITQRSIKNLDLKKKLPAMQRLGLKTVCQYPGFRQARVCNKTVISTSLAMQIKIKTFHG